VIRRLIVGVLLGALCGAGFAAWEALDAAPPSVPAFQEIRAAHRSSDVTFLDRTGEVLHEQRTDLRARRLAWTRLSEISPALIAAVIASEDRRFYRHTGVDFRGLAGALLQRLTGGPPRGGSTISMQVATFVAPDLRRRGGPRSLLEKWRQMRVAWSLESRWSKTEILETYLNRVTFRGELQGIAAATHVLASKEPHGITEPDALVLGALIRSPGASRETLARRAWSLREAVGGHSSREEIAAAAAGMTTMPPGNGPRTVQAPHFARRLLTTSPAAPPGAAVRTTLDGPLQRLATETLVRQLLAVREGHVRDGAVLAVDNASGDVLAYVGGSGILSSALHVDGVQARRQAGSTLKPFLYGMALERRLLTSASLLEDTPLDVPLPGGIYRPRNYDDRFRGLVSVRTALAGSVNVPAVRTLALVGSDAFVAQLQRLGLDGVTESGEFYGPSLALGSVDVSLWELVNAYRSLANGGRWSPLRMAPDPMPPSPRRVYNEQTAFLLSSILADRESRSITFGLESPLATRFWTAVKTGTSKDMRDNWCIGYSNRYTVGVWVGNFSGEPMWDVSGITGAAPVWLELMAYLHRHVPGTPPTPPGGVVPQTIGFPHGVESDRTEWFLAGTEPIESTPAPVTIGARILAPASGTLIALDPGIPAPRQRVVFEAQVRDPSVRWVLDGLDLGPARGLHPWQPTRGAHTLSLADAEGRSLDTVGFEVRGADLAMGADPDSPEPH
jgi:penicillin-binding protein 1C